MNVSARKTPLRRGLRLPYLGYEAVHVGLLVSHVGANHVAARHEDAVVVDALDAVLRDGLGQVGARCESAVRLEHLDAAQQVVVGVLPA